MARLSPIQSATLGVTPGLRTLVLSPRVTLTFDASGHPRGVYENGFYTARGWDGRCVEKKWLTAEDASPRRHLRELTAVDRAALRRRILRHLADARRAMPGLCRASAVRWLDHGRERRADAAALHALLDRWETGTRGSWDVDARRFRETYRPLGILPPDQYLSAVFQLVEGCAWNRCSFCDLYAGRRFRLKSADDFERHVDEVERLFGPSIAGRCSVFLGDGDAFSAPPDRLLESVKLLARRFPALARPRSDGVGGVYAFGEVTGLERWSAVELRALREAGFRRVYVGLETGDPEVRAALRKPGSPDRALAAAEKCKAAGINVGVIVLLGVGGRDADPNHTAGTAGWLARAPLGPGDLVYFSPLRESRRGASPDGGRPLTDVEMADQRRRMEAGFDPRGARRAWYDIGEFLY